MVTQCPQRIQDDGDIDDLLQYRAIQRRQQSKRGGDHARQ